jgi:thioesterase domain-containing protein/acyl carrier protein
LQQAALTAEKFVPHPYSGDGGERLYRTGDKVRYLSDGRLEFIGRIDGQVKVRGYRIELGEIEAVLGQHAQVREAVVLARSEESGEQRLVAYVVGRDGHPLTSAIRLYLRERLPQYMVPSSFVMLEQLPLLPNKKIDRPALASIGSDETHSLEEGKYVAARDIVELKLTQIWEKVLGVAPIGVRDNFFDLGGHSLLAMRLMALIHEGLNVRLPLSVLFREATVEELAKLLREQALPEKPTSIVEIQPGGDNRPFFCVHPMGGNVFCYLELARYLGPDQPFYAIQPAGLQGGEIPEITLEEIARSYLQEVRTVQPEGPYLLGGWSFGGVVAFEMAQQLRGAGQEVSLLALLEASALVVRDRRVYQGQADVENSWSLARMVWRLEGRETPFTEEDLQRVRQDERLNYILEQAKKDRVLGVDFELAYLLDWARGIKNSFKALADYEPRFYPGKVAVFEAEERLNGDDKSRFGWDELAQEVEAHVVSGNHFTIILEPHVRTLAQHLRESILTHSVHRV